MSTSLSLVRHEHGLASRAMFPELATQMAFSLVDHVQVSRRLHGLKPFHGTPIWLQPSSDVFEILRRGESLDHLIATGQLEESTSDSDYTTSDVTTHTVHFYIREMQVEAGEVELLLVEYAQKHPVESLWTEANQGRKRIRYIGMVTDAEPKKRLEDDLVIAANRATLKDQYVATGTPRFTNFHNVREQQRWKTVRKADQICLSTGLETYVQAVRQRATDTMSALCTLRTIPRRRRHLEASDEDFVAMELARIERSRRLHANDIFAAALNDRAAQLESLLRGGKDQSVTCRDHKTSHCFYLTHCDLS